MSRVARIVVPGYPHHVVQRGHNRATCFHSDAHYGLYRSLLAQWAAPSGCAVHAYVLMPNHVHLLLTPATATALAKFMRAVNQRYVQWVNRTSRRHGSAFQGRFHSSLVESDAYLVECHRYIEQNPVRARLVGLPRDWLWSSHRANAEGEFSDVVVPHPFVVGLAPSQEARRARYRDWFEEPLDDVRLQAIRTAILGNRPVAPRAEGLPAALGERMERKRRGPRPGFREKPTESF